MASGRDMKRVILTTRWLPDHPGIFRQAGIAFALSKEGIEATSAMVYAITKSLWDTGFIERSVERTAYQHAGGILHTHWYRFARLDRESTKPGWRPGEHQYAGLWKEATITTPRVYIPEHPRSVPTSRAVKGLPNPADLEWAGWENGPQTRKAYVMLYLGFELRDQVEEAAREDGDKSRQDFIRRAIEQALKRRRP